MKRFISAWFADPQSGHRLGLLNPETVLEYEDEQGNIKPYNPSLLEVQKFLWEAFTKHIGEVKHLAGKDDIFLGVVGDVTQGNHYANEWVSTRIADQFEIALWNMKPWTQLPNLKRIRICKGTAVHSYGEGTSEMVLAKMLRGEHPKINTRALYHGLVNIGGVNVDYAHHGPVVGSRNWLKGNEARYYLRSLMEDEFDDGNNPPDLVVRAHYHDFVRETLTKYHRGEYHTSNLIILPSYCILDDHARKATKSIAKIRVGMVAVEIVNGKILDIHPFIERLDIRTKENIK